MAKRQPVKPGHSVDDLHPPEKGSTGAITYPGIIGASPSMQQVYSLLSQVAASHSTVLLLGETGTGKELIARAIHQHSPRRNKMLVNINCAALPANLIESELFGHEKGSFTGAIDRRIGKFELANLGTIFLDEIGDMPPDLQVKLLRALQEKEIERIGGKAPIRTDVRVIAATNRNLHHAIEQGRFRSDLFYRLNVFPITLPPLRERKEDIPLLVEHFLTRFARQENTRLAAGVLDQLQQCHWPGNVRELEHLIERSILLNEGSLIKKVPLPGSRSRNSSTATAEPVIKTLEEVERDHILYVLRRCGGKIFGAGGAAELLGLHVSTLNHRIRKLGIQKEQVFTVKKEQTK
ncbi:sigma-54 dependent transcriptional regulator [Paraflavitalea sp. CAU 1676]|uniref:sigma-54 interaction domain-containing protein n=1 Tax=Paraflavitalea sp. CAU 1676 TaxID=3032598 RepID=UPI0023DA4DC0|nr:sigma-54 dependent transcriptional regulator [Paraflavitalea sp. CAU 1676]MDF2191668.1 sigma-54 dependent transcriptional regulator [Paraflavitalea sp. CAU 1676]